MVHWPEVIVTYDTCDKVLFSADGFGKFGALDVEEPWDDESRRYFIGIVGKYGKQVQNLLKKAATLDIQTICPLHLSLIHILIIRKYHIDFHIILCIYPDQLIFKSRNESSASQLQLRVCSFQIIRALSIHIPGKINGKHISLFCRTIHVFQLQILFLVIPYLFGRCV